MAGKPSTKQLSNIAKLIKKVENAPETISRDKFELIGSKIEHSINDVKKNSNKPLFKELYLERIRTSLANKLPIEDKLNIILTRMKALKPIGEQKVSTLNEMITRSNKVQDEIYNIEKKSEYSDYDLYKKMKANTPELRQSARNEIRNDLEKDPNEKDTLKDGINRLKIEMSTLDFKFKTLDENMSKEDTKVGEFPFRAPNNKDVKIKELYNRVNPTDQHQNGISK